MAPYNLIFLSKFTFYLSSISSRSSINSYVIFFYFFYLNCNKILFQVAFHNYKYLIKHISFKCCIIVSGCLLFGEENFPPIKYFDTPSSFINLLLFLYCYQIPQYSFKQRLEGVFVATEDVGVLLRFPRTSFVDWIFHSRGALSIQISP